MREATQEIKSLFRTWRCSYRVTSAHTLTYVNRLLHSRPRFESVVNTNQGDI